MLARPNFLVSAATENASVGALQGRAGVDFSESRAVTRRRTLLRLAGANRVTQGQIGARRSSRIGLAGVLGGYFGKNGL
jgi:hypothetical protein